MPLLSCTARTCVYNSDEYCSKGDIQVTGGNASVVDETACASFKEQNGMANSTGCGQDEIKVDCSAVTCIYNKNKDCHAGAIDINGSKACTSSETCCGTFRKESK